MLFSTYVMLGLASLPSFFVDKNHSKKKTKWKEENAHCVIFARNLSKFLGGSGTDRKCKHFTACGLEELLPSTVFNFLVETGKQ